MKKFIAIVIIGSFVAVVVLVTTIDLFLGENAPAPAPAQSVDDEKVALLIVQLAHDDVKKRNAAFDGLRQIGAPALPQLNAALDAVRPEVAADIRTLIKLIGGKPPEAPAPQGQAQASQPPAAAPQDWSALPELPKPAAQPQGGDAPSAPAIRTGSMTAAERAAFERKMQQDKNLRDLILLLRSLTPEKQEETLVWMQINWGENSWEFEKIRRYLGLTLSKPEMPATPFALDLLDSLGARLTSAQDGMRVTELRDGSPAAAAGLRVGDLITHLNGRPLTDLDKAREWLGQQGNGQPARLDVKRRNDELTLTVPNQ